MNAKKIMGAVLVALLALTAFAGVAAADPIDKGIVFVGQTGADPALNGHTLYNGAYSITISGGVVSGDNVEGTYADSQYSVYVSKPTAKYNLVGNAGSSTGPAYIVANGGKVYQGSYLTFTNAAAAKQGVEIEYYLVKFPDGKVSKETLADIDEAALTGTAGTYSLQAIFNAYNFTTGFDTNALVDTNAFTFTVVEADDATIVASVDTVYSGDYVTFTIEGTIGVTYYLELAGFDEAGTPVVALIPEANSADGNKVFSFEMPNTGVANFQFKVATTKDEASVKLSIENEDDASVLDEVETVKIAVSKPVITAAVGATSYFIGNEIEISGTSTAGADLYFSIEGTNFKETLLVMNDQKFGKTWEVDLETEDVTEEDVDGAKKLDVGTYTINIYQGNDVSTQTQLKAKIDAKVKPVKTVVVALKQPFISIIEAPEVVVQGTDAEFVINAEATDAIKVYVFGTNYFTADVAISTDKDLKNKFTAKLNEEQTSAKNMSAGQYFMVIQHPMYDGDFNIAAVGEKFYLNTSAPATATGQFLFNVNDRQTANAAQALCDALDTQNIDDMYVKYSFFIVGEDESFTISDIPSQIAKGTTLVISGVDTANAEETVVVEMISTAFAAVPKETVGSAAFIAVTTEVAEDGTWEVTLDTSDLNVDEYSLSVVINDATKKNVKINVVEGADTPDTPDTPDVPDTPDTPDTPTEPETPGFGALAALAGLGAVAVLLLRRE